MCLTALDFCAVAFQRWKFPWRNVEVKFHNLKCDKILFYLILNFIAPLKIILKRHSTPSYCPSTTPLPAHYRPVEISRPISRSHTWLQTPFYETYNFRNP